MQYWKGSMNWPIDVDWTCEVCGTGPLILAGLMASSALTWGLIHAQCRCDTCHAIYRMRDSDSNIVTTPISQHKEEYKEAIKALWKRDKVKVDDMMLEDLDTLAKELA